MKILLLANHARRGGIASYLTTLARELVRRGHKVLLVTGHGESVSSWETAGAEHRTLFLDTSSEANPRLLASAAVLRGWVEREGWQVVHAQTRVAQTLSALALGGLGAARVTTCHGFFKTRILRRAFPFWGDRVIAISRAVERHLTVDWKVDPGRVAYVPHGVEKTWSDDEIVKARSLARKELNLAPATVLVGALGRLSPVKGYRFLIEAMAHLRETPVELLLIGDGEEAPRIEGRIRELNLVSRVRRVQSVPNHHAILHAFDIFCAPSLQEGLGLAALDAMARCTPVVASGVGGLNDLIRDGETGRLVKPADPEALARAIRELAADPDARNRLGAAGRRFVEREFSLCRMIDQTERVYQEALFRQKS